jgi:hypothetical protein
MSYYYNGEQVREFDAALMQAWIDAANPKASGWVLIADPPGPGYTWDGTEWVAPPVYIPTQVTAFQARAALLGAGLLDTVQAAVDGSNNPTLMLAWEYALHFERQSPTIAAMSQALGMTDAQVDELFTAAAQIEA